MNSKFFRPRQTWTIAMLARMANTVRSSTKDGIQSDFFSAKGMLKLLCRFYIVKKDAVSNLPAWFFCHCKWRCFYAVHIASNYFSTIAGLRASFLIFAESNFFCFFIFELFWACSDFLRLFFDIIKRRQCWKNRQIVTGKVLIFSLNTLRCVELNWIYSHKEQSNVCMYART